MVLILATIWLLFAALLVLALCRAAAEEDAVLEQSVSRELTPRD
jgi:hypothetical protein